MRIVNPTLTRSFLRRGKCRFCGKTVNLCAHHLFSKGAGQLDISINLIALGMPLTCDCHVSHHQGNEPSFEQLLALSAMDHNCLQGDIETVVYLLRDQLPKGTTAERIERAATKLGLGARRLLLKELVGFRHLLGAG